MPKLLLCILFFSLVGCGSNEVKKEERPLVYEGMPKEELEYVLGQPIRVDSLNPIFDGETMKKMPVEKWVFKKRTVILINDSVKNPNFNSGVGD